MNRDPDGLGVPPPDAPRGDERRDDPRRDEELIELVAQALDALEEGEERFEAFCRAHPAREAAIRRRVELLDAGGLRRGAAESAAGGPGAGAGVSTLEEIGDFTLLRPLGGGGMGVVWLARQRSLGREVALKLVRPDQLLFPGARERFQREVETVAHLQHPGIVPVYAVGEERGLPYFAMERVRGLSLADALEGLERGDGAALAARLPAEEEDGGDGAEPSALFDGAWSDVCARIAREVAEALEHARRRGVVHRDVKPSNVMITRGGRVLLCDFGLAWRAGDPRMTRDGSAVGSLAYLPPEALGAGGGDGEDPRRDVYSLGATLYEMLALRPPFAARSHGELVRAIEAGARPLAAEGVSWELATIVAVAMEKDPARRYPHAGALARDLANALERRPIEARPPSAALRVRRWVERHPARAALFAALVVGPSVLLAREIQASRALAAKNAEVERANQHLGAANQELATALQEARAQRALAQASFERALEAVDRMLLRVGEHRLAGEPRMEGVRRELVADALDLYGWFLERDPRDSGLALEVARVAYAAGNLHGELGDLDAASGALDRADRLLANLVGADPGAAAGGDASAGVVGASARLLEAAVAGRRATIHRLAGRRDEAEAVARATADALERLDPATLDAAQRGERERLLASTWTEIGVLRETAGDTAGGLAALDRSVASLRALPLDGPAGARVRYDLARNVDQRGRVRARAAAAPGREPDATELFVAVDDHAEAIQIFEEIVRADPSLPEPRFRLARALTNQAFALSGLREYERGIELTRRAMAEQEALVASFPGVPLYALDLGQTCVNVSAFLAQKGEIEEGRRVIERGLQAFETAIALGSEAARDAGEGGDAGEQAGASSQGGAGDGRPTGAVDISTRLPYATALVNLAGLREAGGDLAGALAPLERARDELALVLADLPGDRVVRGTAWMVAYRLGSVHLGLGRPAEALEAARGLLAHGPGLQEIETFAHLAQGALAAAPPESRDTLLALAAAELARLLDEGTLEEARLADVETLAALHAADGLADALAAARAR